MRHRFLSFVRPQDGDAAGWSPLNMGWLLRDGEFTRLDSSDKPGAGLGLSIARRVARLLGGDVTVSGGRTGGARFTLWLPLRQTA